MNGNYKSGNSCYMKEFHSPLVLFKIVHMVHSLYKDTFIRHHRVGKCGEVYGLLDNPTRCATHGLITPHHC
jgi:hypothetical protein